MSKKLKLLLIDDDPHCLKALRLALAPYDEVEIVGELEDGTQATAFLRNTKVDAVFLDIEMASVNGFDLANHLRNHYPDVQVIFQTGHVGYAVDGYEYQPADFLVKPIDPIKVERALSHVKERLGNVSTQADATIGIRTGAGLTLLRVESIVYIEKVGRKVYIVCENGDRVLTSHSLQELQTIFASYDFIRCQQSVLVPLRRIQRIQADEYNRRTFTIQLEGADKLLPLSRERFDILETMLIQQGIAIY